LFRQVVHFYSAVYKCLGMERNSFVWFLSRHPWWLVRLLRRRPPQIVQAGLLQPDHRIRRCRVSCRLYSRTRHAFASRPRCSDVEKETLIGRSSRKFMLCARVHISKEKWPGLMNAAPNAAVLADRRAPAINSGLQNRFVSVLFIVSIIDTPTRGVNIFPIFLLRPSAF